VSDHFVGTAAGRIHFLKEGVDAPTIFLLHGNGQSAHVWQSVMTTLATEAQVVAWDLPGQGDSDPLTHHLTIEDYSGCLIELMESLSVANATVVGASVGGQIAATTVTSRPDLVDRIVLAETNYRPTSWWEERWFAVEERFAPGPQSREFVASQLAAVTEDRLLRWNIDRAKAGRAMMSVMWALRDHAIPPWLPEVRVPTLLLFGEDGPAVDTSDQIGALLPNARTVVLRGCGHLPMVDQPDELASTIMNFVRPLTTNTDE
jgi:pimeloyl-ACP methyl ester carboxylesterase